MCELSKYSLQPTQLFTRSEKSLSPPPFFSTPTRRVFPVTFKRKLNFNVNGKYFSCGVIAFVVAFWCTVNFKLFLKALLLSTLTRMPITVAYFEDITNILRY